MFNVDFLSWNSNRLLLLLLIGIHKTRNRMCPLIWDYLFLTKLEPDEWYLDCFTLNPHHRRVEVGRDLWRMSTGSTRAGCSAPRMETTISSQPISAFDHLHRKKLFLRFKLNFLCFSWFPLPFVLLLVLLLRRIWLCHLPPVKYLYTR